MQSNSVFNSTVCLMGILILLVHIVNILTKKDKRKADSCLSDFFVLTAVHFATYLAFTIIKTEYTSNAFIISFYTLFYIMNNLEVFLLFRYMLCYVKPEEKTAKALKITNNSLFVLFVVLDIVNIFTGIFFTAQDGVYTRNTFVFSHTNIFRPSSLQFASTFAREESFFLLNQFVKWKANIVFCGNVHKWDDEVVGGVTYLTLDSMCEENNPDPGDYLVRVHVKKNGTVTWEKVHMNTRKK